MRFTVHHRNGATEFESPLLSDHLAAEAVQAREDFDSEQTKAFATSIAGKAGRYPLSDKQRAWLHYFATRQELRPAVVNLKKVVAVMYVAKINGLKRPVVRISHNERIFKLNIATDRSRNPGAINVIDGMNTWIGLIEKSGDVKIIRGDKVAALDALQFFADSPEEAALNYARETGACSFCGRELTRDVSIKMGYGPICAEKYCLPYGE